MRRTGESEAERVETGVKGQSSAESYQAGTNACEQCSRVKQTDLKVRKGKTARAKPTRIPSNAQNQKQKHRHI